MRSGTRHASVAPARGQGRRHVVLFTNSVTVGGMEEHVVLLAQHLDRHRFEVSAVAPDWPDTESFSQCLAKAADRMERITPDRRYGLRRQVAEARRLVRFLRSYHADVIHLHSTTFWGQAVAVSCARLAGVRAVYVTEHLAPDRPLNWWARLWRNLLTRCVSGIVCVSDKNRVARAAHLYTPVDRTVVVPNGVDPDDFPEVSADTLAELRRQHDIPPDAAVVGTVVRFAPEKGLNDLLDAFALVRQSSPDAHLLMVGDGPDRADLEARAARLGIADVVRFVGFQPDPRPYLALMDAFVLPVPVGSMSIGLLEAMAMRRAVVITFGGEGEAVVHGESGYLADARDPASIATWVLAILADPANQAALGKGARERVETEFSAQRVARTLGDLYVNGPKR